MAIDFAVTQHYTLGLFISINYNKAQLKWLTVINGHISNFKVPVSSERQIGKALALFSTQVAILSFMCNAHDNCT